MAEAPFVLNCTIPDNKNQVEDKQKYNLTIDLMTVAMFTIQFFIIIIIIILSTISIAMMVVIIVTI